MILQYYVLLDLFYAGVHACSMWDVLQLKNFMILWPWHVQIAWIGLNI